jgi:hypothetical protein
MQNKPMATGTRLSAILLLALALTGIISAPTKAATIHVPASGASVQQDASLYFDWAWDSDEYATSAIVFTQSADPADPIWTWGPGQANADPRRIVVSDLYGPYLESHATVIFTASRFVPGTWYWRLCNKSIYGEDDKCSLDAELRSLTVTAKPPPPPPPPTPCTDGIDNDRDGTIDSGDSVCQLSGGTSEGWPSSAPSDRIPTLSVAETKHYFRVALAREFKNAYRHSYAKRIAGCTRLSRLRIRCGVSWVIGDLNYRGKGMIWLTREDDDSTAWNYAWTIRRVNEYCRSTGGRRCTKTYRRR